MRNLPNLANVPTFQGAQKTLRVRAADASTTWVFSDGVIAGISPLTWEAAFLGGLARPTNYEVALVGSASALKDMLVAGGIVRGTATLRVDIASHTFYPHVGTVRGYSRSQPNAIQLTVVDRTLDNDPLLPHVALTDSWATPHLEHLTDGEPWQYGDVTSRPVYFVAVTSNTGLFIGPNNVSSAVHSKISKIQFGGTRRLPGVLFFNNIGSGAILSCESLWEQQSGATNTYLVNSLGMMIQVGCNLTNLGYIVGDKYHNFDFVDIANSVHVYGNSILTDAVVSNVTSFLTVRFSFRDGVINMPEFTFNAAPESHHTTIFDNGSATITVTGTFLNSCLGTTNFNVGDKGRNLNFIIRHNNILEAHEESFGFQLILNSNLYKKFSVFHIISSLNNLHRMSISENPLAILDHVHSFQTSIPFHAAQSSAAQVAVQSFAFQGYVGPERQRWSALVDEFCSITGVTAWLGDSGVVNYRAYANSGAATVDASLGATRDLLAGTFRLREAPVGSTLYEAEQAAKLVARYGYVFHTGEYGAAVTRTNSLVGNSVTREFTSKWVLDPVVASLWGNTLAARLGGGRVVAEFDVGPQRLGIELGDVLSVAHPLLVGSATLMQVKRVALDLQDWKQSVTAVELVARS